MIETVRKPAKRIFGLDLLRVVSILLVLCSHTSVIYPAGEGLIFKIVDMCGFFGVELFFIMSGFLIGGIIFRQFLRKDYGPGTTAVFLYRRLMRILPNYYLIVLVNAALWTALGYPIPQLWKYFLFLQNFATPLLPFFTESWSLPIKEFGYFIAVLLLLAAAAVFKRTARAPLFLIVISAMTVFFFCTKIYYDLHTANLTMLQWDLSLRSVVIYRIDAVLLGVLCGYVASEHPQFWRSNRFPFAFLGGLLLLLLVFCLAYLKLKITNAPFFWNVLVLPLADLGLLCFLPFFSTWQSAPAKITSVIVFVSELSYCVYLLHYSLVLFLMKYFISTSGFALWELHLFTLGYLVITFSLSFLMYTYFEKPAMKLRDIKI